MVAELVHRLSLAGVVSRDTLGQALIESSAQGVHLLQVLATRHSSILPALEGELARSKGASAPAALAIDYVQVLRLPVGLCKRLLAVPLQVDPTNARWTVAAADPTDAHVASEISYHLGGPVDVVRAPLAAILNAVMQTEERALNAPSLPLMDSVVEDEHTPAFGTAAIMPLRRPSGRWLVGEVASESKQPAPRRGLSLPPVQSAELQSEPPIPLVRPLASRVAEDVRLTQAEAVEAPGVRPDETRQSLPAIPSAYTPQEKLDDALADLEEKSTAREVLQGLASAVAVVANRVAVFTVRAGQFHLEVAWPVQLDAMSLGFDKSSVLNAACLAGYYLGPLTRGTDSEVLAKVLDVAIDSEIYVMPVVVAERPAAVIVAGAIENTFAATRFIDKVAGRGGEILERMIQRRRQKF